MRSGTNRPPPPLGAVVLHDLRYAGETAATKLALLRAELEKLKADVLVVSDPHSVTWLFNIRGSDVPHTPVVLAFALVPKDGRPALYIDSRKLGNDVRRHLEEIADLRLDEDFERDLAALGKGAARSAARSGGLPRGDRPPGDRKRRYSVARRRSDHADESGEELSRDRRAPARRNCATVRR